MRYNTQVAGIVVTNEASDVTIERNRIHDNGATGLTEDSMEVGVGGISSTNVAGGIVITDNLVEDNAGVGIRGVGSLLIARNVVRHNGGNALMSVRSGAVIENNVFCGNGGAGIVFRNTDDVGVRHNTFVRAGGPAILVTEWANENVIEDNVMAFGEDVAIGWVQGQASDGTPEAAGSSEPADDHNVLFGNAGGDFRDVESGANNRMEDPGLLGVAECNISLSPSSPLLGSATDGLDVGADLSLLQEVLALGVRP